MRSNNDINEFNLDNDLTQYSSLFENSQPTVQQILQRSEYQEDNVENSTQQSENPTIAKDEMDEIRNKLSEYLKLEEAAKDAIDKFCNSWVPYEVLSRLVKLKIISNEDVELILNVKKHLGYKALNKSDKSSVPETKEKIDVFANPKTKSLFDEWYVKYNKITSKVDSKFSKSDPKNNIAINRAIGVCLDVIVSKNLCHFYDCVRSAMESLMRPMDDIKQLIKATESGNKIKASTSIVKNIEQASSNLKERTESYLKLLKYLTDTVLVNYLNEDYKSQISSLSNFVPNQNNKTNFHVVSESLANNTKSLLVKVTQQTGETKPSF